MKKHPYGTIDPLKSVAVADRVLDEFFGITRRLRIKSFLAFGLCLGLYRDGEYIEGDNDLDVGVVCDKKKKKRLINALINNGFTQGRSFRRKNTHFHKNKILVDVHFYETPGIFYTTLEVMKYKDKEYPAPYPVKVYLAACYSDWKIKQDETCRKGL